MTGPVPSPAIGPSITLVSERHKNIEAQRTRVQTLKEELPESAPEVKEAVAKLLEMRQLSLENDTVEQATAKYREITETMVRLQKSSSLSPLQRQIIDFYVPLVEAIDEEQRAISDGKSSQDRSMYGPLMQLLPPDKIAVITLHTVIDATVYFGESGASFVMVCKRIADSLETEVNLEHLNRKYGKSLVSRLLQGGALKSKHINQRAKMSLESGEWTSELKVKLGAVLCRHLLSTAFLQPKGQSVGEVGEGERRPAFRHASTQISYRNKAGLLFADPELYRALSASSDDPSGLLVTSTTRHLPMLVEPKPWTAPDSGGYLQVKTKVMRTKGGGKAQGQVLRHAPLERVYEGLTALGKLPWVIHAPVLDVFQGAWDSGFAVGELPSQEDEEVPLDALEAAEANAGRKVTREEFVALDEAEREKHLKVREAALKVKRVKQRNSELHSLRCDVAIKLGQAQQFRNESQIFFPYNMDFRGRAYPIPPNLNHLGSDMCRGLLRFARRKELGESGMFWLKVQLASLCGFDKASFQERAEWTEERMSSVYDSALNPLEGERWWCSAENPGQALAACMEIVSAYESSSAAGRAPGGYVAGTGRGVAAFESGLPVHMDGSCNGLQHYAALGRDFEGGKQVNLVDGERPRDVYSGVCAIVVDKVAAEAARTLGPNATDQERREHESAKLVNGLIDRKVVKQTVMTSVYGVTYIGARRQIQNRLEEKLEEHGLVEDPDELEEKAYQAASYVAYVTMDALAELFTGARSIMEWLGSCARLVAKEARQPMAWVTPLGLPVTQPYRRGGAMTVRTVLQSVTLVRNSDDLSVDIGRQRSAFPPNFVHSLDSTHMLLTTLNMQRKGLDFTAVHDSYWTHACDVEAMNHSLRTSFVKLYQEPILEDLHSSLLVRFPTVEFPPLPERGHLDLEAVSDSTYFFN